MTPTNILTITNPNSKINEDICIVLPVLGYVCYVFLKKESLTVSVEELNLGFQKDLDYEINFLEKINKKLGNEYFINKAKPDIVELEHKKKFDCEMKIKALKKSIELNSKKTS